MTPGARIAAAIDVLDQIGAGAPAEQALTAWARGSRYAGSKDRAAVRDHVFDVLRARRSLGDGCGRSLMIRLAMREQWPLDALFSGEGHAPAPVAPDEISALWLAESAACDVPDWLWTAWQNSLGDAAGPVAKLQQGRADVFLRVNTRRGTVTAAQQSLATDGVATAPHQTVKGCLRVNSNPRRVKMSTAYLDGLVELQDAASQHAIAHVPVVAGGSLLDYCAGGGGKALGFADRHDARVFAHDIAPARMRDLPQRASRAGVRIDILTTDQAVRTAPYDVVFCDAPCSGSGTWRRTPDAKWRLSQERLDDLMQSQDEVLRAAAPLVKSGGTLAYATCSVLDCENKTRIERFIGHNREFTLWKDEQLLPSQDGDGFYLAILLRR